MCIAMMYTHHAEKRFCQFCGSEVVEGCVVCPSCCRQIRQLYAPQPQVVINNSNNNVNTNQNAQAAVGLPGFRLKNKWVTFFLCLFLGFIGAHKFYEGKIGMGILYMFTCGLLYIGVIVDLFVVLTKPTYYYI